MEKSANPSLEHEIEWDDKKVARLWDYYGHTLSKEDAYFSKVHGHRILRLSNLPLGATLDVLDFGCGPGFIWDHLRQLGARWQYTALDFSPDSVRRLTEKASGHEYFEEAQHVSQLPTDLPEAHFDIVLLLEVAEHLNDAQMDGTLAEITRLLKQGGCVVITTPNEEDLSKSKKYCPECGAVFHEWQHVHSWSVASLSARVKQHGYSLRMVKTLDFNTQDGTTAQGVYRKIKRLARRLLKSDPGTPHMIAVFQKI